MPSAACTTCNQIPTPCVTVQSLDGLMDDVTAATFRSCALQHFTAADKGPDSRSSLKTAGLPQAKAGDCYVKTCALAAIAPAPLYPRCTGQCTAVASVIGTIMSRPGCTKRFLPLTNGTTGPLNAPWHATSVYLAVQQCFVTGMDSSLSPATTVSTAGDWWTMPHSLQL